MPEVAPVAHSSLPFVVNAPQPPRVDTTSSSTPDVTCPVLGHHLADLFDSAALAGMAVWRHDRAPEEGKEHHKLMQSKSAIGTFNGLSNVDAASFLRALMREIFTKRYTLQHANTLCTMVFVDVAAGWFRQVTSELGSTPIVKMITLYRARWLDTSDRVQFLERVRAHRLHPRQVSELGLQQHHANFMRDVENAQAVDRAYSNDMVQSHLGAVVGAKSGVASPI